jgi:hypothetical protein
MATLISKIFRKKTAEPVPAPVNGDLEIAALKPLMQAAAVTSTDPKICPAHRPWTK